MFEAAKYSVPLDFQQKSTKIAGNYEQNERTGTGMNPYPQSTPQLA